MGFDSTASTRTHVHDGFTVVTVGDVILGRRVSTGRDPDLAAVVRLARDADVVFGNLEGSLIDFATFTGYPAAENGGAYHVAPPGAADDLVAIGFNMVNLANNHALDWGVEGMRSTIRALDRAGVAHAGTGESLGRARAPAYLETPGGRVALVSVASSFTPLSRAGAPTQTVAARPGVSVLRLERTAVVPGSMLEALRRVRDTLPPQRERAEAEDPNAPVTLLGQRFQAGNEPGFTYEPDTSDVRGVLRSVREGKQLSDFLILTQHAHEPGNWSGEPANYLPAFARSAVDAGADMFVGHGPHQLRGVEIYHGRPIFYSLGNFIFHDSLTPVPRTMYEREGLDPAAATDGDVNASMGARFDNDGNYVSAVAVSRFGADGRVAEIRLYPIELRRTARLADRGTPRLAPPDLARTVLERLRDLSAPFGTVVEIQGSVGVIHGPE